MRIKNNTPANLSVYSATGTGYMTVVGESTLELDDNVWKTEYAERAKGLLKSGNLEITKAPALTEEEIAKAEEAEIKAAEAVLAKAKAKTEAKKTATK